MLPFTAISSQLLQKPWINEFYGDLTKAYNNSASDNPAWSLQLLKGRVMGAPSNAYDEIWNAAVKSNSKDTYDDGDSKTNTLYVISSFPLMK
jgi:endo-1,3(4)-beta-glucanase